MSEPALFLALVIGGAFGAIAAAMAYLIIYSEYLHHFPDRRKPRRIALQTALFTFLFFFGLAFAVVGLLFWSLGTKR